MKVLNNAGQWEPWAKAEKARVTPSGSSNTIPRVVQALGDSLWDVVDVLPAANMDYAFVNLASVTRVPWFDAVGVRSANSMFRGCSALLSLPALDLGDVTQATGLFYGCSGLTDASVAATLGTRATLAGSGADMFYNCRELSALPWFDTSNLTTFSNAINGMPKLLEIPAYDASKPTAATAMNGVGQGCTSLTRFRMFGFHANLDLSNTKLNAEALNEVFANAGAPLANAAITVKGTPGAASCDPSIATAKGWKVVTA